VPKKEVEEETKQQKQQEQQQQAESSTSQSGCKRQRTPEDENRTLEDERVRDFLLNLRNSPLFSLYPPCPSNLKK
jgi:hypothetical protein